MTMKLCSVRCVMLPTPSNCSPRVMWSPDVLFNPTSPNDNDIGQQQPLSPSKSNEEPTQKNGINPELALITSKSS